MQSDNGIIFISIKYTNRPFGTVEEMNEKLIEYWNKTIHQNEEVYILGDVTMVRPARANCKGKNSRAIPYCGILCHGGGFKSDLGRCRSADEISMKFELTKKQALSSRLKTDIMALSLGRGNL